MQTLPHSIALFRSVTILGVLLALACLPLEAFAQVAEATSSITGGIAPNRQPATAATAWERFGLEFDLARDGGLSVAQVAPDSPAARAGLQSLDRLVSIDGFVFLNPQQVFAYLSGQSGRAVNAVIERGNRRFTAALSIAPPKAELAWLGVYLAGDDPKRTGARILQVHPDSSAARAGVRANDVILSVEGIEIVGAPSLILAVEELKPGSDAELIVLRGTDKHKLNARLGRRPQEASGTTTLVDRSSDRRTIHYGWR